MSNTHESAPRDDRQIYQFFGGPMDGEKRAVPQQDINPNGEIRFGARSDSTDQHDPADLSRTQTHVYRIHGQKALFDRSF